MNFYCEFFKGYDLDWDAWFTGAAMKCPIYTKWDGTWMEPHEFKEVP